MSFRASTSVKVNLPDLVQLHNHSVQCWLCVCKGVLYYSACLLCGFNGHMSFTAVIRVVTLRNGSIHTDTEYLIISCRLTVAVTCQLVNIVI
jgi:hypothetical protein